MKWTTKKSCELYGMDNWGKSYFSINNKGEVCIQTHPNSKSKLSLQKLVDDLAERGIRSPTLIRFPQIIKSRVDLLHSCFISAIKDNKYQGSYQGLYPIKVNQQRHIVEEMIKYGEETKLGLECGTKSELLISLAFLNTQKAHIVCNGFKDDDYIRTALLSLKINKLTYIVVDRMVELPIIIRISKELKVKPKIGFRIKLYSKGNGRWVESSGEKSKFGLTPSEVITGFNLLKEHDMLDCLELIHYHIGSQIPSIHSIKQSLKEAARFYSELHSLGAKVHSIDVGGGLGIDYDGTGSSDSSTNYDEQEYANDVIHTIQSICDENKVPHPNIITESGRSLVAHSSLLVFDVIGQNNISKPAINFKTSKDDSRVVLDLFDINTSLRKEQLTDSQINELYNDLIEKRRDILQLFSYGVLTLPQRAKADDLYWSSITLLEKRLADHPDFKDIYLFLKAELTDTYFCNFSIFQSLPDAWAVGQRFPIIPLNYHCEEPTNRAFLADLTCDSDGKLDTFINLETQEEQSYLNIHHLDDKPSYTIGVFLTGAYQEILGDLHNLFGDTDTVHINIFENSTYEVSHVVSGDSVQEVLSYLEYHKPELIDKIRKQCEIAIGKETLTRKDARMLINDYERGLSGYTYLKTDRT